MVWKNQNKSIKSLLLIIYLPLKKYIKSLEES
jgi:hypothetical protein